MTANRSVPTSGNTGGLTAFADVQDDNAVEIAALWQRSCDDLTISAGSSTADALVASAGIPLLAYAVGNEFTLTALVANTGPVTINIDGLGDKAITDSSGTALGGAAWAAGEQVRIRFDGAGFRASKSAPMGGSGSADQLALFAYQLTAGTNGGTATSGSRQTYPLNTQIQNGITGCIFDAPNNRISALPAGTYEVDAQAGFYAVGAASLYLRNDTAGADVANLIRKSDYVNATIAATANPQCLGRFTLTTTSIIKLQYSVQGSRATNGLGNPQSDTGGAPEQYGMMSLRKVG